MASEFEEALARVESIKTEARMKLSALADAVRANPDDLALKAEYREAADAVAKIREFERGGNAAGPGNIVGGLRGIAGDITVTRPEGE